MANIKTRGDKRLNANRERAKFRGADTVVTIETGLRADTRNVKQSGSRGINSNIAQNRANRRAQFKNKANNPKIDAVGTPKVGRDIIANEEAINEAFGGRTIR